MDRFCDASQSLQPHRLENIENHFSRQEFNDNRSVHQHLQLSQSISAEVVAQAAVEVDLARRQTQEVYDQALTQYHLLSLIVVGNDMKGHGTFQTEVQLCVGGVGLQREANRQRCAITLV